MSTFKRVPKTNSPLTVLALVISGILFTIYMWFYLSPLFRGQGPTAARRDVVADAEMNAAAPDPEKASLITWIHRSSLGRFIDVTGRLQKVDELQSNDQGGYHFLNPPLSRGSSFSSNATRVPQAVPLTPPPPAYGAGTDGFGRFGLKRHYSAPLLTLSSPSLLDCSPQQATSTRSSFESSSSRRPGSPGSPLLI